MRILATILIATLLGAGATYAWRYYGGFAGEKGAAVAFVDAYGAYDEAATQVETLVHLPGAEGNDDRAELLALLSAILTEKMDDVKRESLARIAFTHLDTIKREIDAAQAGQARLYALLQDLDNASRVFRGIELRTAAEGVVQAARSRAEVAAHILSLLSDTNEHTYAIITRILAEHGALSSEHATAINAATAEAEERHNDTAALYDTLAAKHTELLRAREAFTERAFH